MNPQAFAEPNPLVARNEGYSSPMPAHFEQLDQLERSYKSCLRRGDAAGAQQIALQIEQVKAASAAASDQVAAEVERSEYQRRGRAPQKGEEQKLRAAFDVLRKQAAKLTQERSKTLARLTSVADRPPAESAFDEVRSLDRQLSELNYRVETIQLALSDIEKWHRDQEHQAELARDREARQKQERKLRAKNKELDGLIQQVGETWQRFADELKKIAALSNELQGKPFTRRPDKAAILSKLYSGPMRGVKLENWPGQLRLSATVPWPEPR